MSAFHRESGRLISHWVGVFERCSSGYQWCKGRVIVGLICRLGEECKVVIDMGTGGWLSVRESGVVMYGECLCEVIVFEEEVRNNGVEVVSVDEYEVDLKEEGGGVVRAQKSGMLILCDNRGDYYIRKGEKVKDGQLLGQIEVMKLYYGVYYEGVEAVWGGWFKGHGSMVEEGELIGRYAGFD